MNVTNRKPLVHRCLLSDTDRTRFARIEGKARQRRVPLHLLPRRCTSPRLPVTEPEVVVNTVEVQAVRLLIDGEVHDEHGELAKESAEHIRYSTPRLRMRARLDGSSLNMMGQERKDWKNWSSCSGMPKKRRMDHDGVEGEGRPKPLEISADDSARTPKRLVNQDVGVQDVKERLLQVDGSVEARSAISQVA